MDEMSLPFLTRKMLDFQEATTFGLRIVSQAAQTDVVTIRGATKAGAFTLKHTPTNDSVPKTEDFNLPDLPLWITISMTSVNILRGDCFVTASLIINGDLIQDLTSGYISSNRGVSWPTTDLQESQPPIGLYTSANGSDPAAGNNISITVPDNQMWRVHNVKFQLVAAAAAASRVVHVLFTRGSLVVYEGISATAQIISETKNYHVQHQTVGGSVAAADEIIIPMPPYIDLFPGDTITTVTDAKNAGDNYGIPTAGFERFFIRFTQ